MNSAPSSVEHLVIGGGPAGAMAAIRLACAGRKVRLVEKEPGPHHKVCGEFLSREAVEYLHQAGIVPRALGAAPIGSLRLSAGRKLVEAPLPFQALSLSRRVLDEALLARAAAVGCVIQRGVAAASLSQDGGAWLAALGSGETLRAEHVFLATGKHELRGFARAPARQADLVGFKLHWRLGSAATAALRDCMELFLFSGGYGGIALVENDAANLCLVVRRQTLRGHGGWPQLLAAICSENRRLAEFLENAQRLFASPLAISPIPYGYLAGQSRGLWCIGDQAAVIPSFTGDGISIALHSAALAAQVFLAGGSINDYERMLRAQLRRSMALAMWISKAAVTRVGRVVALPALSLSPGAMRWVAARTRIPAPAMLCLRPG